MKIVKTERLEKNNYLIFIQMDDFFGSIYGVVTDLSKNKNPKEKIDVMAYRLIKKNKLRIITGWYNKNKGVK